MKSGNQRKFGRNAKKCSVYEATGQRLKNKKKRLRRHIKHFPEDSQAATALGKL